jgi:signal peptide peptidase SppA
MDSVTWEGEDGGCARPDQLFGWWGIEPTRFGRMVAIAKGADVAALRKEARKARKEATAAGLERPLYGLTREGIGLIEITGPMTKYETSFQALFGGTSTLRARRALRSASLASEVLAIMVLFDSPGGTIAGTSDLTEEIRAADARKPVFTYAQDLTASAALWAASAGRRLFANKGAEIGSIGAYGIVYDTSGVYAQEAVKVHVVSSAPPLKGAGVEGTEITPAQLAEWERQIKDLADVFVTELAAGRRLTKKKAQALHTGQLWVAEKAQELGLVDDIVSLDEAMLRLRGEADRWRELGALRAKIEELTAATERERTTRDAAEKQAAELRGQLEKLEAEDVRRRARERHAAAAASRTAVTAYERAVTRARELVEAGKAAHLARGISLAFDEDPALWAAYERERNGHAS